MKKKSKTVTGLRYIGRAAHLDVPRRDLTPKEVEQFGRVWLLSLRCANTGGAMYAEIEIEQIQEVDHGE